MKYSKILRRTHGQFFIGLSQVVLNLLPDKFFGNIKCRGGFQDLNAKRFGQIAELDKKLERFNYCSVCTLLFWCWMWSHIFNTLSSKLPNLPIFAVTSWTSTNSRIFSLFFCFCKPTWELKKSHFLKKVGQFLHVRGFSLKWLKIRKIWQNNGKLSKNMVFHQIFNQVPFTAQFFFLHFGVHSSNP